MAWRFQLGYKMCMNPSLRNWIELNCNLVVAFGHLMCNEQSFHQNEYSHGVPPRPLAVTTVKLRNDMDFKGHLPITSYHCQGFITLVEIESVRPGAFQAPGRRVLEKSWLNSAAPICEVSEFQWT